MAENINQHFVPKFYFRNFSKDTKSIMLYLPAKTTLHPRASISGQCSKKNYYGHDDQLMIIESYFKVLEGTAAKILKAPQLFFEGYSKLAGNSESRVIWEKFLCFVVTQLFRTPVYEESQRDFLEHWNPSQLRHRKENPDWHLFSFEKSAAANTWDSLLKYTLISDLVPILVKAPRDNPLLTSDHPVVMTNFAALTGLVKHCAHYLDEAGLSIYYPLSPRFGLLLVDRHVYRWPKKRSPLKLSIQDVQTLNLLQFQNCEHAIYGVDCNQETLDDLNRESTFLPHREVVTKKGNFPAQLSDSGEKLAPVPYTFQHHYQAIPARSLSILENHQAPKFRRVHGLERDIRHNHPGPAASDYMGETNLGRDTLWKFSEYISKELKKQNIIYPPRALKHPYEILSDSRK
jgi:hypothetical protein